MHEIDAHKQTKKQLRNQKLKTFFVGLIGASAVATTVYITK
jgi:hypothetical protein